MKAIKLISLSILVFIIISCEKNVPVKESNCVFIKLYCATITVGGFVGIREQCFNVGDTVFCTEVTKEMITIRIAGHSHLNDGLPSPNSYQEYLNVPSGYLELLTK